jgi:hypothetical protein
MGDRKLSGITTTVSDKEQWRAFFAGAEIVTKAADSADRKVRLMTGSGFNVFDWIRPIENDLSDIIRDLLDPLGSHGQGDIFLKTAFDELFVLPSDIKFSDFTHPTVIREAATFENRRIDIRIDANANSQFSSIAIENKPWTGEGEQQLDDYAKYLERRSKNRSFCLLVIYGQDLKLSSLRPETRKALEAEHRFHAIPYRCSSGVSLHRWLTRCAEKCHADKVRWFLRDFADYVADQFPEIEKDVG